MSGWPVAPAGAHVEEGWSSTSRLVDNRSPREREVCASRGDLTPLARKLQSHCYPQAHRVRLGRAAVVAVLRWWDAGTR